MSNNLIKSDFSRFSSQYDNYATLQYEVAGEVVRAIEENLPLGRRLLDLGAGTGFIARHAVGRWPMCQLDIAEGMCIQASCHAPTVQGDMLALPYRDGCMEAVSSSLALQWVEPLSDAVSEIARVLVSGGCVIIATLIENTLCDLRQALIRAELHNRINMFKNFNDISHIIEKNNLYVSNHFCKTYRYAYENAHAILKAMHKIGAGNKSATRTIPIRKSQLEALNREYAAHNTTKDGKVQAEWEVAYFILRKAGGNA